MTAITATSSFAQDAIVMRKPLPRSVTQIGGSPGPVTPTPSPTPAPTPGTSPTPTASGRWTSTPFVSAVAACSPTAPASRTVSCVDKTTGEQLGDSSCADARPAATGTVEDYRSCSYRWQYGSWSDYSEQCSASATHTRETIGCLREQVLQIVGDDFCTTPRKTEETVAYYGGCTGTWASDRGACESDNTYSTGAACKVSGETVSPINCNPTTRPQSGRATCSGSWVHSYGSCNTDNVTPDTPKCVSQFGTTMPDINCNPATRPAATPKACAGTWSSYPGTCSGGQQTPVSTCRGPSGALPSTACNPATKPGPAPCAVVTCPATLTQNRYYTGGTAVKLPRAVYNADEAVNMCRQYAYENPVDGVCAFVNSSQSVYYVTGGTVSVQSSTSLFAGACKRN